MSRRSRRHRHKFEFLRFWHTCWRPVLPTRCNCYRIYRCACGETGYPI